MLSTTAGQQAAARRHENLALAFQEILTVSERLRSGRQEVHDAGTFRHYMLEGLKAAEQQARANGYSGDDIKLAVFAVVAFVDESVLNLRNPVFADWPRRPLQEELFGHHVAGEIFFRNLQELLARTDSHECADVLEVYHVCLLLGFAGRYSIGGRGELRALIDATAEKIKRIRGVATQLSPVWRLPHEDPPKPSADPWIRKLIFVAAACGIVTLLLFIVYKVLLGSGISSLGELVLAGRL